MGVFRQFPYSNFHEMNMDEIIKIIKNMLEEWAQYHAEWDAWMGQMNDDWSNYQDVMNEAWQDMQDFINNYFDNLDVQNEINNKISAMVASGEFTDIVVPYIPARVTEWLSANITQPVGVVIDKALTVEGACADALSTGNAIQNVGANLLGLQNNEPMQIKLSHANVAYNESLMSANGNMTYTASHCVIGITDKAIKKITVPEIPSAVTFPAIIAYFDGSPVYYGNFSTSGDAVIDINLPYDIIYLNWLGGETASPTFTYVDIEYKQIAFKETSEITALSAIENVLTPIKIVDIADFHYKKLVTAGDSSITISDSGSHSYATMPSDNVKQIKINLESNLGGWVTLACVLDSNDDVVGRISAQTAGEYSINLDTPVSGGTIYVNLLNYATIPNPNYDTINVLNYTPINITYHDEIDDIVHESTDYLMGALQHDTVPIRIRNLTIDEEGKYISASGSGVIYNDGPSHAVYKMPSDNITQLSITILSDLATTLTLMAVLDSEDNVVRYINGLEAGTYTINLADAVTGGYVLINLFNYQTTPNPYYNTVDIINYELITKAYMPQIAEIVTENVFKTMVRKPFSFNGKTAIFVGDSITYGATSGSTNVHGTGDFPTLFSAIVGLTETNLSVGGALYCSGHNLIKTIPEQVEDITTAPDFLFISGGINDWQLEVELSELETTIENLCDYINTNFPTIPVIWITPINEAGWETTHSFNPVASTQAYRDLITRTVLAKDTNSRFSVIQGTDFNFPSIDSPSDYINAMFGDLLHPSALGYSALYVPGLLNALC